MKQISIFGEKIALFLWNIYFYCWHFCLSSYPLKKMLISGRCGFLLENGKVVFTKEIQIPSLSQNEVLWNSLEMGRRKILITRICRVVYQNRDKGEMAATGKEYIIFFQYSVVTRPLENELSGTYLLPGPALYDQADQYSLWLWCCLSKRAWKIHRGRMDYRRKQHPQREIKPYQR